MITEALRQAVVERELIFQANLAHAVAVASLYGHPQMDREGGWKQVQDMYVQALDTLPYIKAGKAARAAKKTETDALIDEWRRLNNVPADGQSKES